MNAPPLPTALEEPIPFGAFELRSVAGRGGMGEVWRGHHRAEDVPVAIKFMSGSLAQEDAFRALFRHEVRMAAGLDHPNVVMLFDQGEVSAEAAERSLGALVAGTPYLVMEWASGGSLAGRGPIATWPELLGILTPLLDALGHAHARGVVHRDLKPGNVLLSGPADPRPGLKLADFGAAYRGATSLSEPDPGDVDLPAVAGTRSYMAPEQAEHRFRDEGPWTDLFSLGVLSFRLATGQLPWPRQRDPSLPYRRVTFEPVTTGLPAGFLGWLERLLEVDPGARVRRASDAASELASLATALPRPASARQPEPTPAVPVLAVDRDAITRVRPSSAPPAPRDESTGHGPVRVMGLGAPPVIEGGVTTPRRTTLPAIDGWRSAPPGHVRPPLRGAGLALYGLRTIPLVDRDTERALLWSALVETATTGQASFVVLTGAAGSGKSRLAQWLAEHAHERGDATALRAIHGPLPGPGDGIAAMIARHLGVVGPTPDEARERCRAVLRSLGVNDPEERAIAVSLLVPDDASETRAPRSPAPTAGSAAELHATLARLLALLSRERPLVLWLDDVQWGAGSLAFAAHLSEARAVAPARLVVVLTVQDDVLAQRELEQSLLETLIRSSGATRIEVGPLLPEHRGALVRGLLGLDAELAARVEERTQGNPSFAVELVLDWTRRDLLEHGPSGFLLRSGASVTLPDDVLAVWGASLDHFLGGRPEADAVALELAATLGGLAVEPREWAAVCARSGVVPSPDLLEALAARGLSTSMGPGSPWSFAHGMLREVLEARARRAGRLREHHRASGAVLALAPHARVDLAERLGRHWLLAGELEAAVPHLIRATEARLAAREASRAYALSVDVESALSALADTGDDARRELALAVRADAARMLGRYEEASALSEELGATASEPRTRAMALMVRGAIAREQGQPPVALRFWREALEMARAASDRARVAQLARWIAVALTDRGDLAGAARLCEEALAEGEDAVALSEVEIAFAVVQRLEGRLDEAEVLLGNALSRVRGIRGATANVTNALGELARWRGQIERAEQEYERAANLYEATGSRSLAVARLNLGLARIEGGRAPAAEPVLRSCLEMARRQGRRGLVAMSLGALQCPFAARRDWGEWDRSFDELRALVDALHLAEIDLARALGRAADLARGAGEGLRAKAAYELAISQFRALGRDAEAAPLRELLDGLDSC